MKRILVLLIAMSASALTFAQTGKLGHINFQEVMLAMPERSAAEQDLQAFAKEYEDQLNSMKTDYQTKVEYINQNGQGLPEAILQTKVNEIQQLEQNILQLEQQAQLDLAQREAELIQPMVDKVNAAVEEVAKAEGFTYIIDSSAGVLLYSGGTDVGPQVKAKLGIQ